MGCKELNQSNKLQYLVSKIVGEMTVPGVLGVYYWNNVHTEELKFKLSYKYAVAVVVIQFTVFKHRQLIYMSI